MTLHVDPEKAGSTATAWDTENLNLKAAAKTIDGVTPSGFTEPVSGLVDQFLQAWSGYARKDATIAESQADGLRKAAVEIVQADVKADGVARNFQSVYLDQLRERR